MDNLIIIAIVAIIVVLAGRYVIKAKKSGAKCIGCHGGCSCSSGGCGENCSCGHMQTK